MVRKFFFITLVILLIGIGLGFSKINEPVLAFSDIVDENAQRHILAATVRITLFAPLTDEDGSPIITTLDNQQIIQLVAGEGLGTLIRQGDQFYIVTHDHWTLLTPNLLKVQFHNIANELLLEVSGAEFQQMIRYRDGGTTILAAPAELVDNLAPVEMGISSAVNRRDVVLLAFRHPQSGEISVATMAVKNLDTYQNRSVFQMTSLNGENVVPGNSGGGLFFDGRLVGNMWTTTMEREVSRKTGEVVSAQSETSMSLVAQLPAFD